MGHLHDGLDDGTGAFAVAQVAHEGLQDRLAALCDQFRSKSGYDCLLPGSGGKDSFYASHILKTRFGMHPLTVTWAPHLHTDWGWKNFQAWIHAGFDNVLFTPNAGFSGAAKFSYTLSDGALSDTAEVTVNVAAAPVGFVLARLAAGEAEILTVAVARTHRRHGLGWRLMDAVLRQLHADRAEALFRLGMSEEAADLIATLSPAQIMKIASGNMLLCRFRVDDDMVWKFYFGNKAVTFISINK